MFGDKNDDAPSVDWIGIGGLIFFYLLILFAGLFAKRLMNLMNGKKKQPVDNGESGLTHTEDLMLAGRNINYAVGVFTMTATWVGGGYINGAAEAVISGGVLNCQAPFCFATSLCIGGLFFAKKMRSMNFITMLDPFQVKYGRKLGSLLYIPAFSGEILWSAAILAALGTSLQVICQGLISENTSIIVSAMFAMVYTLFGGLYSVAFTDVFQLISIFVGLILALPFMITNDHVTSPLQDTVNFTILENDVLVNKTKSVLGEIDYPALWVDSLIMMICGGIPWQAYFQRVLSSKTPQVARVLSYCAGVGCFLAAIPPVIMGVITINTDWLTASGGYLEEGDYKLAVPLCLSKLCPPVVSFIGLGAVSAAVMSSTDSSVLGVSSMFTRNVYQKVLSPHASDKVLVWVLRVTIVCNTLIAMVIAITVKSVYGLYVICSDLVYVLLFPHLVLVLYGSKYVNRYGMVSGFSLALLLRVLCGEPVLGFDAIIRFPGYVEGEGDAVGFQNFPFRLTIMLLHFSVAIGVTFLTDFLHAKGVKVDPLENYKFRSSGNTNSSCSSDTSDDDSVHKSKVLANAAAVKFEPQLGEITITGGGGKEDCSP